LEMGAGWPRRGGESEGASRGPGRTAIPRIGGGGVTRTGIGPERKGRRRKVDAEATSRA